MDHSIGFHVATLIPQHQVDKFEAHDGTLQSTIQETHLDIVIRYNLFVICHE